MQREAALVRAHFGCPLQQRGTAPNSSAQRNCHLQSAVSLANQDLQQEFHLLESPCVFQDDT